MAHAQQGCSQPQGSPMLEEAVGGSAQGDTQQHEQSQRMGRSLWYANQKSRGARGCGVHLSETEMPGSPRSRAEPAHHHHLSKLVGCAWTSSRHTGTSQCLTPACSPAMAQIPLALPSAGVSQGLGPDTALEGCSNLPHEAGRAACTVQHQG